MEEQTMQRTTNNSNRSSRQWSGKHSALSTALLLLLTLCWNTAQAQDQVFLGMDPESGNPTTLAVPSQSNAPIVFRSINLLDPAEAASPYVLIFEAAFEGRYETAGGFTPGNVMPNGMGVMFQSEDKGEWTAPGGTKYQGTQEVRIKLKTGSGIVHPPAGYKYSVLMGGKLLDPRIVPK
jgi:hypothetical protein